MKTLEEIKKELTHLACTGQVTAMQDLLESTISQTKQELIEEVKKMRKCQYNSNKPEYKMTKRFITELLQKLSNK